MKNIDIKFAASQALFIAGLIVFSVGERWSFFIGVALLMISSSFSLRRVSWPTSRMTWIFRTILWIMVLAFLMWITSFGTKKPPLVALLSVWFGSSIDEFDSWRKNRKLT